MLKNKKQKTTTHISIPCKTMYNTFFWYCTNQKSTYIHTNQIEMNKTSMELNGNYQNNKIVVTDNLCFCTFKSHYVTIYIIFSFQHIVFFRITSIYKVIYRRKVCIPITPNHIPFVFFPQIKSPPQSRDGSALRRRVPDIVCN